MEYWLNLYHDLSTDRWHPMFWRESPRPSYQRGDSRRLKSGGHHTAGFSTETDALMFLTKVMIPDFTKNGFTENGIVHFLPDMQGNHIDAMIIDIPPFDV